MLLKILIYWAPQVYVLYNPYKWAQLQARDLIDLIKATGNLFNAAFWPCREADLKGALQGLGETVLQQVTEAQRGQGGAQLPQESLDLLKGQISELWKHNNPVCMLIGEAWRNDALKLKCGRDRINLNVKFKFSICGLQNSNQLCLYKELLQSYWPAYILPNQKMCNVTKRLFSKLTWINRFVSKMMTPSCYMFCPTNKIKSKMFQFAMF